jgi:pimeloyl-ACP methyl ester carboxylesterase
MGRWRTTRSQPEDPVRTSQARLHDSSVIPVSTWGSGPAVVLPLRTKPYPEEEAAQLRLWGADPDAGRVLATAIAEAGFTAIAADYEAHRMAHPAPDTLTADGFSADLLALADAAGAREFAYAGYSWTALGGLQLALRTDRLRALAMGGFPPVAGPYREMLAVTRAAHAASLAAEGRDAPAGDVTPGDWDTAQVQTSPAQTRQFLTLYESLQDFDDDAARARLTVPRLAYAGEEDDIVYSERWGGVTVRMATPLREHRERLEADGWRVELLPGRDHLGAMHSEVSVPLLTSWLATAL